MSDFDPDAYLGVDGPPKSGGFDPDAYLSNSHEAPPDPGFSADPFDWGVTAPQQDEERVKEFTDNAPKAAALYGGAAVGGLPGELALPKAAGIAINSAAGAGQGAVMAPEGQRIKGAAIGGVIPIASEGVSAAWPYVKKAGAKLGEMITGVPEQEIKAYASRAPEIKQMLKESGGSVPDAADNVREGWQNAVRTKRQALNEQVSQALEAAPKEPSQSIQPIIDELEAQKSRLDPTFHAGATGEINGLISKIKEGAAPEDFMGGKYVGMTNAKNLNLIKQYLQGRAAPSYMESGQIFQTAPQAAQAAKAAAAKARLILNEMEPGVAQANNSLAELHDLDGDLNTNLLAPGKSDAALMAAGSGANQRNAMMLKRLGDAVGQDFLPDAQNLAAARTFGKPIWSPTDMTGKSMYRAGAGAAIGAGVAHAAGLPWQAGAAAGGLLTSPAALKGAIDAGRAAGNVIGAGPIASTVKSFAPAAAAQVLPSRAPLVSPQFDEQILQPLRANPALIDKITTDENLKAQLRQAIQRSPATQ